LWRIFACILFQNTTGEFYKENWMKNCCKFRHPLLSSRCYLASSTSIVCVTSPFPAPATFYTSQKSYRPSYYLTPVLGNSYHLEVIAIVKAELVLIGGLGDSPMCVSCSCRVRKARCLPDPLLANFVTSLTNPLSRLYSWPDSANTFSWIRT
jgi:hypothetical protein